LIYCKRFIQQTNLNNLLLGMYFLKLKFKMWQLVWCF